MRYAIPAVSMLLLTGCGGIPLFGSSGGETSACPSVRPYEQGFRASLAADIERLPAESLVRVAMADYWMLRAEAMACERR